MAIYNFNVTSPTIYMTTSGTWSNSNEGYYYAVIPLEVGNVYKVTLQNITTLSRFRCSQSDSNVIGEGNLSFIGHTESPADEYYISFVAEKNYLICYGGTANGGAVSVISASITTIIGTKWKMHSDAKWILQSGTFSYFQIDGAFYEGETQLTALSADNNIFIGKNKFGYGSILGSPSCNITPQPIVDNYYANERWRVYVKYGGTGVGWIMRELTDTLYLEITGGVDAESSEFIAWVFGAGELWENEPQKTSISYNGETTEMTEGQTATLACANKKAKVNIVIAFGSAGAITYNGSTTEVEAGKTATLQCAGKKMTSDVLITVPTP